MYLKRRLKHVASSYEHYTSTNGVSVPRRPASVYVLPGIMGMKTVWYFACGCFKPCDLQCVSDRVIFGVVFSHTVYFSVVVFSDRVIFIVCLIKTVWSIDTPISIDTGILYIYRSLHRLRIRQSFIVLPMHILPMREQTFESRLSPNREVTRVWKVFFNVSA